MKLEMVNNKNGKLVKLTYKNLNENNFDLIHTSHVYSTGQLIETFEVGGEYYDKYYPTWLDKGRIVQNFFI